jgi:hypothetical protein
VLSSLAQPMMAGDRSDACTGVGTWKQHLQTAKVHFINRN